MPRSSYPRKWYAVATLLGVVAVSGLGTGISFALTPVPQAESDIPAASSEIPYSPSPSVAVPAPVSATPTPAPSASPTATADAVPPVPEPTPEPVAVPAPAQPGTAPVPTATVSAPTRAPTPPSTQPNASNTGVPAGTSLVRYDGDIVITQPGTVIQGLDVHGLIWVQAANVTIRDTIVRGREVSSSAALVYAGSPAVQNLLIEDSELAAASPSVWINGVMGANFTLRRVNIHGVIDQVHIFGNNVKVQSSWLHDNLHYANDPNHSDGSHDDNIQVQSGNNLVVTGNTLSGAHNSSMQVTEAQGVPSNLSYTSNWASGGGCTVNISQIGKGQPIPGVRVTGNRFGASTFSCPIIVDSATLAISNIANNTMMSGTFKVISR